MLINHGLIQKLGAFYTPRGTRNKMCHNCCLIGQKNNRYTLYILCYNALHGLLQNIGIQTPRGKKKKNVLQLLLYKSEQMCNLTLCLHTIYALQLLLNKAEQMRTFLVPCGTFLRHSVTFLK